jgi:transposase-like protein
VLRRSGDWTPQVINTDKNPAYGEAITQLKKEGRVENADRRAARLLPLAW